MRGINYLAALGTVLIFGGVFCFKAMFPKKVYVEETLISKSLKSFHKVLLGLSGTVLMLLGVWLILKAGKLV
ncbi:MAG: hypothetical protein EOO01_28230 [Chitinophagaceae bacterium]|nr:MAG: hypothetical protein EOO01_28230 [Chitinophagaceae bacterium]